VATNQPKAKKDHSHCKMVNGKTSEIKFESKSQCEKLQKKLVNNIE